MRSGPDPIPGSSTPGPAGRTARRAGLLAAGVATVVGAAAGTQLWRVWGAAHDLRGDLASARTLLPEVLDAVVGGDPAGALPGRADALGTAVTDLRQSTRTLANATSSWPVGLLTHAPVVGRDVAVLRRLAADADVLAGALTGVAVELTTDPRAAARTGPLDLRPVTAQAPGIRAALRTVDRVAGQPRSPAPRSARLAAGVDAVHRGLPELQQALRLAATVADVGAGMTGEQGARRYLVVLQTPAESRATGGLVGGFLEVVVDQGRVSVARQGSNAELRSASRDVVTLPGGFAETWGSFGAQRGWASANFSPDFPAVAKVWAALYEDQFSRPVDGVVGVTPQALAGLLRGTPPLTLPDGTAVRDDGIVPLLERGIYDRFPATADEPRRNAFQQDVLRRLVDALLQARPTAGTLAGVRAAVADGSLRLASLRPEEQADLAGTTISGSLPRGPAPFVGWTTQNASASKLDSYLHRTLTHRRQPGPAGRETATATLDLRNDAPARGLPEYVTGNLLGGGRHEVLVATYLTSGATVTSVTVDGRPVEPLLRTEGGHPVVLLTVPLAAGGGTARVVVVSDQPASPEPTRVLHQLVANPDVTHLQTASPAAGT